jgi:hypothetical protein
MSKNLLSMASMTAGLALVFGFAAESLAWTKTYAVEWFEPANYFDPYDKEAVSAEVPGNDCPKGVTPELDYPKMLIEVGHQAESVQHLYDPEVRNAPGFDRSVFANRGGKGENVYREPWHAIEHPYPIVEGKLAYGFDLDNNPATGFTGVDGTPGVDNNWYKVVGCVGYFRGRQRDSGGYKYSNESMHNGAFTILIVLEGKQDLMNDPAATLSFKISKDPLVRDAAGGIAWDYSFRVDNKPEYESTVAVVIQDGVIEIAKPQTIVVKDWKHRIPLTLSEGQLKFKITDSGKLEGAIGGYREWEALWRPWSSYIPEIVTKLEMPAYWYALRRHADGMPDPTTGEKKGISTAFNIWAVPAFEVSDLHLTSAGVTGGDK